MQKHTDTQSTDNQPISTGDALKCDKCTQIFKTSQGLKKHYNICNTLECQFCHKVFSSQYSTSQHLKICKAKKETENEPTEPINEDIEDDVPMFHNKKMSKEHEAILSQVFNHIIDEYHSDLLLLPSPEREEKLFEVLSNFSKNEIDKVFEERRVEYNRMARSIYNMIKRQSS